MYYIYTINMKNMKNTSEFIPKTALGKAKKNYIKYLLATNQSNIIEKTIEWEKANAEYYQDIPDDVVTTFNKYGLPEMSIENPLF